MLKKLIPAAIAATTLFLPAIAQAQTTYNGNGATGFGGAVGGGSLTVSNAAGGGLTFTFNSGNNTNFSGNDLVFYIDSTTGGFTDTSQLTDTADGGRTAISGVSGNGRTLATFASGFGADYAVSLEDGSPGNFVGLFKLNANAPLTFVSSGNLQSGTSSGNARFDTFTINPSDIGLQPGQSFKFVASLISTTAYRSNETIGASVTVPGSVGDTPNAGFNGTTTFSGSNTFTTAAAAPEPSEYATLLIGGASSAAHCLSAAAGRPESRTARDDAPPAQSRAGGVFLPITARPWRDHVPSVLPEAFRLRCPAGRRRDRPCAVDR